MTYERLGPHAFRHADGSEVKIISNGHIEYAEKGRRRVAVVGFAMPSARRLRIFTHELSPSWILERTEQQPMSDADRKMVLDHVADAYRFGEYEVVIEP
jgi:hypothetical protein